MKIPTSDSIWRQLRINIFMSPYEYFLKFKEHEYVCSQLRQFILRVPVSVSVWGNNLNWTTLIQYFGDMVLLCDWFSRIITSKFMLPLRFVYVL
ncbi:hypothetical protein MTR67_015289 [Solanum verrucosum]|uniref:Uncharacterized protein n=1 Tax=Solanum verrucosum TaxID=315347 RepID=A0AAF0QL56_SOLVR|nr:hypothetical protein MTR67_015289 [Solanum verrucosum]